MNQKEVRIITAAFLFSRGYSASDIGEIVERDPRTLSRWSDTQTWHDVLEVLDFEGDRASLRQQPPRDIQRESGDQIESTHAVYRQLIKEGCNPRNAARQTSERTGLPLSRVRQWERRFGWREID